MIEYKMKYCPQCNSKYILYSVRPECIHLMCVMCEFTGLSFFEDVESATESWNHRCFTPADWANYCRLKINSQNNAKDGV